MRNLHKSYLRKIFSLLLRILKDIRNKPVYRVVSVDELATGKYEVTIQIIGTSKLFVVKPEEILASDPMTNKFSPCDIRAITYLGYLGVNSPKYRVLARSLADDERMLFMIHRKGSKQVEVKTAREISQNEEILKNLDQKDAHLVGYTTATEQQLDEMKQKQIAKLQLTTDGSDENNA